jgi:signal peptidase
MFEGREIFAGDSQEPMWLVGTPSTPDSQMLLTLTSPQGSRSAYIADGSIHYLDASTFLDAPEEVVSVEKKDRFATAKKISHYGGYVVAVLLLIFSALSFTGNVKARIVLTGSMAPAINTGDIIVTTPMSRRTPVVGDVVTYQAKRFNGDSVAVFSHRIISGDMEKGFIVKGDSNKSPDSQKPKAEDILGVVIFVIPFIGHLLTPKALFLLVPCLFGLWLILDAMKNVE